MKTNENNYYRIDHSNYSSYIDQEYETKLTISLFMTLASISDETFGTEINKFFDKFISPKEKDLYKINLSLLEKKYDKHYPTKINESIMNYILNLNSEKEFVFTKENVMCLSFILFYSFAQISSKSKYKIKTQNDFLKAVSKIVSKQVDVLNQFFDKEAIEEYNSISSLSIFCSKSCENIFQEHLHRRNNNNFKSMISDNTEDTSKSGNIKMFKYKQLKNGYCLPIEIIILLNKFQSIKKINLSIEGIEKEKNQIYNYLIILFNIEWLFPNAIEIELNLKNNELQNTIREIVDMITDKIFQKAKLLNKTTNYSKSNNNYKTGSENDSNELDIYDMKSGSFTIKNKSFISFEFNSIGEHKEKHFSLRKCLHENKDILDLIILYSYFMSQWVDKIKVITLNMSDSFSREPEVYFSLSKMKIFNFHLLTFMNKFTSLVQFQSNINSLDSNTFEKIIGIVHNNTHLRSINLSLFAEESNYNPSSLYKLCNSLKMNMKQLLSGSKKITVSSSFNDIDQVLCSYLLPSFEENLEKLFFVLKNKFNLSELSLILEIPSLIAHNDEYIQLLTKFLFDVIILLNQKANNNYRIFRFIAPMLTLDASKNDYIEQLFDSVEFEENTMLKQLSFEMKLHKIVNISNLISNHLQILSIGAFDITTFSSFSELFSDAIFQKESELIEVKITLSPIITIYESVKNGIKNYFNTKIKGLKEQSFFSSIFISKEEYIDILNMIGFNSCLIHHFEFGSDPKKKNDDVLYEGNNVLFCGKEQQKVRNTIIKVLETKMKKKQWKERISLRMTYKILQYIFWGGYKEIVTKLK